MKKLLYLLKAAALCAVILAVLGAFAACGAAGTERRAEKTTAESSTSGSTQSAAESSTAGSTQPPENHTEDENMNQMEIIINGKTFSAQLYDNETARAFASQLPLTLDMRELNGNEKYYYMPDSLPAQASRPGTIRTGDLMLYGADCIVLFYKDFRTGYNYMPLGHIDDPNGLESALGQGDVKVTFQFS